MRFALLPSWLFRVCCGALLVMLSGLVLGVGGAHAQTPQAPAPEPATLRLMNREIVVLHGSLAGADPKTRASRAQQRFEQLDASDLSGALTVKSGKLGGVQGKALYQGDRLLLALIPDDVDPESEQNFDALVAQTERRFSQAIAAHREQQHWPTLLKGVALSALSLLVLVAVLWGLTALRGRLNGIALRALQQRELPQAKGRFDWGHALHQIADLVFRVLIVVSGALLIFLWVEFVLIQFPLTEPLGQRMGALLYGLFSDLSSSVIAAIPGLVGAAIILFLTHGVQRIVAGVFKAASQGAIRLPGLHPETAPASQRLAAVFIWALGLTFAYPYIPGSQSDVFKGISVLLGFMLTLGSANIVNQIMSGMVLVYARALRVGDTVNIGDTVGTVTELGLLSVKLTNVNQEQVTLPNAIVVSSAINNYTKTDATHRRQHTPLLSSKVTIGYDTPWRQVHALLLAAVQEVKDVLPTPEPFVLQRALSDFYVEYEVFFAIRNAQQRPLALSHLHAAIQDQFNRNGVQIMSPHFIDQPAAPVVIDEAQWHPGIQRPTAPSGGKPDA